MLLIFFTGRSRTCFPLGFGSGLMPVLYLLKENLFDFMGVSRARFTDGALWEIVFLFVCFYMI